MFKNKTIIYIEEINSLLSNEGFKFKIFSVENNLFFIRYKSGIDDKKIDDSFFIDNNFILEHKKDFFEPLSNKEKDKHKKIFLLFIKKFSKKYSEYSYSKLSLLSTNLSKYLSIEKNKLFVVTILDNSFYEIYSISFNFTSFLEIFYKNDFIYLLFGDEEDTNEVFLSSSSDKDTLSFYINLKKNILLYKKEKDLF